MLKELFINSTILISFLFIGSQPFKNSDLNTGSLRGKIFLGAANGLLSIILMLFSIHVTPSTLLDLRHIALVMSAFFGGFIPSLITGVIISVFRISYFGITYSGIVAAVNILICSVVCGLIAETKINKSKKYLLMSFSCVVIISITFLLVIKDTDVLKTTLLLFWLCSIIVGYLSYYLSIYIEDSIVLFRKLKAESTKDFLTGLNNVRSFDALINKAIENSKNKKESLSFLMVDIDFFKKINDTYGHASGDIVLKDLANLLNENSRSFDEVSRVGGEEFSVILPDCSKENALITAEKLRKAVETHIFILPGNKRISITVSIGLASYPDTTVDIDSIIKEADSALYKAKQSGRNRVSF